MRTAPNHLRFAVVLMVIGLMPLRFASAGWPSAECAAATDADADGDGLSDRAERCVFATDPTLADTDGDGFMDKAEIDAGYSPLVAKKRLIETDTDKDFLNDDWELKLGTGLADPDTDGDRYLDGTEVMASFDPRHVGDVKLAKLIRVSDKDLSLTYSMGGVPLATIPVSTGKRSTPTPKGTFTVQDKIPVKSYVGPTWNYPGTKYNLWFTTKNGWRYYIHGAYWHDKFGRFPVSGGCVNVRYEDMGYLYPWAQHGTTIVIE